MHPGPTLETRRRAVFSQSPPRASGVPAPPGTGFALEPSAKPRAMTARAGRWRIRT